MLNLHRVFEVLQLVAPQDYLLRYFRMVFAVFDEDTIRSVANTKDPQVLKSIYIIRFEAALFCLGVLVDYLYISESSRPEIRKLFELALRFTDVSELPNVFIVKTVLQFMNEFSSEVKNDPDLAVRVLSFCFKHFLDQELLPLASDLFYATANSLKVPLRIEIYSELVSEVSKVLEGIVQGESLENITLGLFCLSKHYNQVEHLYAARKLCFELVQTKLEKVLAESANFKDKGILMGMLKVLKSTLGSLDIAKETGDIQALSSSLYLTRNVLASLSSKATTVV
jgi:hypothetical protein